MRGYVLFAHGSRDPLWRRPIEAVAEHMRERLSNTADGANAQDVIPSAQVACAYLELMDPTLPACVDGLAAQGVHTITIVPMFLGQGRHAREDLPRLLTDLQARHPTLQFELRSAIGEDPEIVDTLARLILR